MPKGISVSEAAQRLTSAGFQLADRYTRGATGKGSRWASAAGAAEPNYQQGVQEAIAQKRFSKGVSEAGAGAYDTGVSTKGAANWGTGMSFAGDKYQKKVQKYAGLWTAPLATPRGAKRSAANIKRMSENVDRFVRTKGA